MSAYDPRTWEIAGALCDIGLLAENDFNHPEIIAATQADAPTLVAALTASGRLTPFQGERVLTGKIADLVVGNYQLMSVIGTGGMGTVYRARHGRLKRAVALKLLHSEFGRTAESVARFQRESEALAQLTHPNIIMAFDAGEVPAGPYLVMEYIDGPDLARVVRDGGPMAAADVASVVLHAARGLGHAHAQGIIHRDMKPANLLRDLFGTVKVADLGLARAYSAMQNFQWRSLTFPGGVLGTPAFMAPEQALDSSTTTPAVDAYSLGCTAYFLLTGRIPYEAGTPIDSLMAHRDRPIPTPQAVGGDIPAGLNAIIREMMAKRPGDRPSMAEIVTEVEALPPPSAAPKAPADLITVDLPPVNDRQQIVVVEPSSSQAIVVREYLKALGVRSVVEVASGKEAVARVRAGGVAVVISAMYLPDMSGIELAQAVKDSAVGFILTTSGPSDRARRALEARPRTAVLTKPLDVQKFSGALEAFTRRE